MTILFVYMVKVKVALGITGYLMSNSLLKKHQFNKIVEDPNYSSGDYIIRKKWYNPKAAVYKMYVPSLPTDLYSDEAQCDKAIRHFVRTEYNRTPIGYIYMIPGFSNLTYIHLKGEQSSITCLKFG